MLPITSSILSMTRYVLVDFQNLLCLRKHENIQLRFVYMLRNGLNAFVVFHSVSNRARETVSFRGTLSARFLFIFYFFKQETVRHPRYKFFT